MNFEFEDVAQIMRDLYQEKGNELFTDKAKLKAVLADLLSRYSRESRLLAFAVDEGIPSKICRKKEAITSAGILSMAKELSDAYAMDEDASIAVVSAFEFAVHGTKPKYQNFKESTPVTVPKPAKPKSKQSKSILIVAAVLLFVAVILGILHGKGKTNSGLESSTLTIKQNVVQEVWTPLRYDGSSWLINEEKISQLNGSIGRHIDHTYEYNGATLQKAIVGNQNSSYLHEEVLFTGEGEIESTTVFEGDRVVLEQKHNPYGDPTEITFFGCQNDEKYITLLHGDAISTSFSPYDNSSCRIDYIGRRIQIVLNSSQKALISYSEEHLIESISYYDLTGARLSESYILYDASNNSYQLNLSDNEVASISYIDNGLPDKISVADGSGKEYLLVFHYDSKGRFDFIEHSESGLIRARELFDYSLKDGYAIEYWIEAEDAELFQTITCIYASNGRIESCTTTYYLDDGSTFGDTTTLAYDENGNITHYRYDFGGIREDRDYSYIRYK